MADEPRAFRVQNRDNVATLLEPAEAGPVRVLGGEGPGRVTLIEPVEAGHKVALADLSEGEAVVKYGVAIGAASRPIRRGQWVHLHNMRSGLDERSATLDPHTGATTDTRYE